MTELTDGSVDAGIPNESIADGGEGSSTEGATNPFSGLQDEGIREWIDKAGVKDVEGLAKKAMGAEKLIGRSVQLPGDDASDDDWNEFYAKAAGKLKPENADGYEFALPEGIPENMPYDDDFASKFKSFAHEISLTKRQAAQLHDFFASNAGEQFTANTEAMAETAKAATKAIEDEWGKAGTETHKAAQEHLFAFVKANGGDDLLNELRALGAIDDRNQVFAPNIVKAMAKAGAAMAEDSLVTGDSRGKPNPFADETKDYGAQNRLFSEDPEQARKLIISAGKDPAQYGLRG